LLVPGLGDKKLCQTFLSATIVPADKRISIEAALEHPWIQSFTSEAEKKDIVSEVAVKNLIAFHRLELLKRAVLTYMATQASEIEIEKARNTFIRMDKNNDGRLSKEEMTEGLKKFAEGENLSQFLEKVDTNKDGYVDYNGINKMHIRARILRCSYWV